MWSAQKCECYKVYYVSLWLLMLSHYSVHPTYLLTSRTFIFHIVQLALTTATKKKKKILHNFIQKSSELEPNGEHQCSLTDSFIEAGICTLDGLGGVSASC